MIYIIVGNDTKRKSAYIKNLCKKETPSVIGSNETNIENLINYSKGANLFEGNSIFVLDNVLTENKISFSSEHLKEIADSENIFILVEDKLLASDEKKYKKYATIERFEEKKIAKLPKINTFAIADAFASRDKIKTWILYREAIEEGSQPEGISGILFWKIKTMLLNGSKSFQSNDLKKFSSDLVSLYHRAHRGESDFVIGLEQFILSSLSK